MSRTQYQHRILIIERSFELALVIDKILCSLHQWKICKSAEVEESVALNAINNTPFDVFITSHSIARELTQKIHVRNLFIYNSNGATSDPQLEAVECIHSSTSIPDYQTLDKFVGMLRQNTRESL